MQYIVINKCYGGFSISREAAQFMAARGNKRAEQELLKSGKRWYGFGYAEGFDGTYERNDPDLIAAIRELGERANGDCSELKIVEIPDGVHWKIEEYDGKEWVSESHSAWS